ncbi:alpha/beta fold hydrolase [Nocardia pseudovaccinii]|uniref:alpha/beta fold hydrolase n=1 Tax=Nocardia pseudovaccinii TaxID=189540 RepID=UPI003D8B78F4
MWTTEQLPALPDEVETGRYTGALGSTLHYHDIGSGDPILFLHSWGVGTTAWITWHKVLPALAEQFRCIALDLPNFTKSGPFDASDTIHTLQRKAAVALLDELGIDRAHIVANSQGAQSALGIAARSPERIDRLVVGGFHLSVRGPQYSISPRDEEGVRLGMAAEADPTPATVRAYLLSHLADPGLVTDDLITYLLAHHTARPDIAAARATMRYGGGYDYTDELMAFDRPALLLWGRDDRTCHAEIGLRALNLLPRSRLTVLRDTGHWPPYERPAEYLDHVRTFLTADW